MSKKVIKEFFLSEILFELNENETLEKKYSLIKKTIDETNFSKAALIYSISDTANNAGKLGWIKSTAINFKILNQINELKKNEYTKPIIIPGGFLILKVEDLKISKEENNINMEKELNLIIRQKTNEQLNQFSNIYFNKVKKNISKMISKVILIVNGEPNSVFSEIFFKALNQKKFKNPIILISSEKILKLHMKYFNIKKKLRILDYKKLKNYKINNKSINLINIEYNQINCLKKFQ